MAGVGGAEAWDGASATLPGLLTRLAGRDCSAGRLTLIDGAVGRDECHSLPGG